MEREGTDIDMINYDYPVFKNITIQDNNSVNIVADFVIERNQ